MSDEILAQIVLRDQAAGDGLVILDHHAATDRHLLVQEVQRLREIEHERIYGI